MARKTTGSAVPTAKPVSESEEAAPAPQPEAKPQRKRKAKPAARHPLWRTAKG